MYTCSGSISNYTEVDTKNILQLMCCQVIRYHIPFTITKFRHKRQFSPGLPEASSTLDFREECCGTRKDCMKLTNYPNGLGSSFRMKKHSFT